MRESAPLLEIKNIETYYGLIYAIRGVSLSVDVGTITAVLGNNGAGKSTILKREGLKQGQKGRYDEGIRHRSLRE